MNRYFPNYILLFIGMSIALSINKYFLARLNLWKTMENHLKYTPCIIMDVMLTA